MASLTWKRLHPQNGSACTRRKTVKAGAQLMPSVAPLALLPALVVEVGSAIVAVEDSVVAAGAPDIVSLAGDNPILASAAALLALGGVALAASSGKPRSQSTGASEAYEALQAEERTVLVDVRSKDALKEEGLVDLKEAKKKVPSLIYAEPEEDGALVVDPDFGSKLTELEGITSDSIVILIDSDGSLAAKAAVDAAQTGFFKEKVYWVRDGMEGPKGWKASDLPTKPYRAFDLTLPGLELLNVDLSALAAELQAQLPGVDIDGAVYKVNDAVNTITDKYKENPTLANGVLAAAGVVAVGAFAVTELEAIIQVVGALGLARFLATNLLFAKDREATLAAVRSFFEKRGLDMPADSSSSTAGGASSAAAGGGSSGSRGALQQLADIVIGARDANSAAQQITDQMVPHIEGVNQEALLAALAAAGVPLPAGPPAEEPQPIIVAEVSAVAEPPVILAASSATTAVVTAAAEEEERLELVPAAALEHTPENAAEQPLERSLDHTIEHPMEHAVSDTVISANILEARDWISAWKHSRSAAVTDTAADERAEVEAKVEVAAAGVGEAAHHHQAVEVVAVSSTAEEPVAATLSAMEAREWIAAWKASQQQPPVRVVVVGGDGGSESAPVELVQEEEEEVVEAKEVANVLA